MNTYSIHVWINSPLGATRNDVYVNADNKDIACSMAARKFQDVRHQLVVRVVKVN